MPGGRKPPALSRPSERRRDETIRGRDGQLIRCGRSGRGNSASGRQRGRDRIGVLRGRRLQYGPRRLWRPYGGRPRLGRSTAANWRACMRRHAAYSQTDKSAQRYCNFQTAGGLLTGEKRERPGLDKGASCSSRRQNREIVGFWLTGLQKKSASPTRRKGAIITGE